MARIRTIKPGFFKDSELYDAEIECGLPLRVAYSGLWTVADREGRFKWKPREIKADVLPYDNVDMGAVLDALVKCGKIFKYKCDGEQFGFIPKFLSHQHVNKKEAPSTIPAPPTQGNFRAKRVKAPSEHHEEGKENGKGKEGDAISNISFETFWKKYPTTPIMPKPKAETEWDALDAADQLAAFNAIPALRAFYAKQKDFPPLHASTFLAERRFDGFLAEAVDPAKALDAKDRADRILKRGPYAEAAE